MKQIKSYVTARFLEKELDRPFERLCDSDHDISAKDPEDVIEEETAQEDAAGDDVVEMEQLHAIDGKCHSQEIVGNPVFLHDVPDSNGGAETQADKIMGGELIIQD